MAAQHDHFVSLVAAANLTDRVVRCRAFGINAIDDIEFENDFGAVIKNPADAAEVFIAHHYRRDYFIDVERLVVESAYLSKLAPSVINSYFRAVRFEERIEL